MEQQDFVIVEWSGGKRKLFKALCATCGCDRGYKKPAKLIGNCKSCQAKINAGTLGIVKECVACKRTEVPNPTKDWFAGPTCCYCYGKKYRQTHKEQIRQQINSWRELNKEKHKARERKWREDNQEHKNATDKRWREDNADHVREHRRNYVKTKERLDPAYRIGRRLRARFYKFVKWSDQESTEVLSKYISYSNNDLKKHLESLFESGMTWSNYTVHGWHIDHIKPLCSFDLTKKEEIIEAWKLSNLRPLWCKKNWAKSRQDKLCKKKQNL